MTDHTQRLVDNLHERLVPIAAAFLQTDRRFSPEFKNAVGLLLLRKREPQYEASDPVADSALAIRTFRHHEHSALLAWRLDYEQAMLAMYGFPGAVPLVDQFMTDLTVAAAAQGELITSHPWA